MKGRVEGEKRWTKSDAIGKGSQLIWDVGCREEEEEPPSPGKILGVLTARSAHDVDTSRQRGMRPSLMPPHAFTNKTKSWTQTTVATGVWTWEAAAFTGGQAVQPLRVFDECIGPERRRLRAEPRRRARRTEAAEYTIALRDHQRAYILLKPSLPLTAASVPLKIARCHLHTGSHTFSAMREALAVTPGVADALRPKKRVVVIEYGVAAY
ncbi:hypothetical protein FOMPIDRAFT_99907 [Fomitopsis schrenkii]|uniref:Uncharacterized protein n=1 Tax=Fomitopsis schrenkii TaxID=2126942 RepID=S8EXX7_FOMSC|nr:hypothetical protein FOMPIDRAFT_99907 [Fomitopsis schrenkii]